MKIVYLDEQLLVCVKPPRVLSTDEPGGLPELLRQELGAPGAELRTVHRLDRVVGGLMVLARSGEAAGELSRQIREGHFEKEYLALVHGDPGPDGVLWDLLLRDRARKMTFVADSPCRDAREAVLEYQRLDQRDGLSLVRIRLHTGRTHQIRVQFASRGLPLAGERKYATGEDGCELALWSCSLAFTHPGSGALLRFFERPPMQWPWSNFEKTLNCL